MCIVTSREYLFHERKWIFCLWNVSVQSIGLKLICLSGQSVYEYHQPQNKNKCGLVKWSNITLLLVNNLYSETAQPGERSDRHYKVPNPSTSIMSPFAWHPTFSGGSGSARTCCSLSGIVVSSVTGHRVWGNCSSWGGGCGRSHLGCSRFGAVCAKSGQTFPSNVAERGLAVRPLWTVSQPSASFLPNQHIRHLVGYGKDEQLWTTNTFFYCIIWTHSFLFNLFYIYIQKLNYLCALQVLVRKFFTQLFPHRSCWLIGGCYRLWTFYSICPAGAWVWQPGCSQCGWRTTE